MALLTTDAVVLQVRDYLESSRIVRLATREAGIVSALARGARRQRAKTGSPLDLFAEGTAHVYVKPTRELQTLAGFEAGRGRPALAADFERFLAASALAEVALRLLHEEANVPAYEAIVAALDAVAGAPAEGVDAAVLGGVWRLVVALGFTPTLDVCASCHAALAPYEEPVRFAPSAGGVLCARCARLAPAGRSLPAVARERIRRWVEGGPASGDDLGAPLDPPTIRAHRRLLREFLDAHLTGDRPLRAWVVWDAGGWPG